MMEINLNAIFNEIAMIKIDEETSDEQLDVLNQLQQDITDRYFVKF